MKKASLKKLIIAVLVVAALSGSSYFAYTKFFAKQTTSQNRYLTETASVGTLNVTVPGTGTVVSATSKDIFATGSGTLSNFNLKVGSIVKQGDSIGTIADTSLDNQIIQDQSKLDQAKAQLTQVTTSSNLKIQQDQITLNQDNAKLSTLTKQTDIDAQNLIIQKDQNTVASDTNSGNSSISNQNIAIQLAQNTLNNDLATKAKENLTAPINGTVVTVASQNGDTLQNGKSIATVEDLSNLQLDIPVDELDIDKVKNGQKVDISFDDIKDKKYTGTVSSVSLLGKTTNNVTTYDILVNINNPDSIKLGMNANVTINVDSKANTLMVPSEAIQTRNGKKYVMVPSSSSGTSQGSWSGNSSNSQYGSGTSSRSSYSGNRTNRTSAAGRLVEVQTGLSNENDIEITSGLKEGDKVLVAIPTVSSSSQTRQQGTSAFGSGSFGGSSFGGGSYSGGSRSGN